MKERYRPFYHFTPSFGWMNDPNGFVFKEGVFHLFYQYNPYATQWGPMHWGHATTADLLHFHQEPLALAPSEAYDKDFGCFSGSSIVKDGRLCLLYTGVSGCAQQQCLAFEDWNHAFSKFVDNPVIGKKDLPQGYSLSDFRDPKVFARGDSYYCLVAAKNGQSKILSFVSKDLRQWSFLGVAFALENSGRGMFECPDLAHVDGKDVLFYSLQFASSPVPHHCQNVHSVFYVVGHFDEKEGRFIGDIEPHEVDFGFDFYASETAKDDQGRTFLIAWMESWDRLYPTSSEGWVGKMCLPRQLHVKENRLLQTPVASIEKEYVSTIEKRDLSLAGEFQIPGVEGDEFDLSVEFQSRGANDFGLRLLKKGEEETLVFYNAKQKAFEIDRSHSGANCNLPDHATSLARFADVAVQGSLKVRIILDKTALEIFLNDGESVLSSSIYPLKEGKGIYFFGHPSDSISKLVFHLLKGEAK